MLIEFLTQAFVTLLVIIDPFAVVPVFVSLTRNDSKHYKKKIAKKSSIIAACLLLGFAFIGDSLLDVMNISEPAFRIAGGFLLLLAAIEMVIAKSNGIRNVTPDEEQEAIHREDISVFPLAIPLLAGPGSLTSVVVLMRQAEMINWAASFSLILILLVVILITYYSLLVGDKLMKVFGVTGTNVLTRVFGIILAALAIENMINGISTVITEKIKAPSYSQNPKTLKHQ